MSLQTLREFIQRNYPLAAGLAALTAALDAKVNGTALDPALAARVDDLLAALGVGDVLSDVSAQEAMPVLAEVRHQLAFNASLMYPETRAAVWNYTDARVLQDVGDFARLHAHGLKRSIVPAIEGLASRLDAPGAAFLDIGVGVAGTAIATAELWPNLRIVGIDVWQPSLALARANVAKAGLGDRIELREQSAESLEDTQAFDMIWMPIPFMPERIIPAAMERSLRALRPGGALILAFPDFSAMKEPQVAAMWRLRVTTWGGPLWTALHIESLLRDRGFVEVRTLPAPPGSPAATVCARRKTA